MDNNDNAYGKFIENFWESLIPPVIQVGDEGFERLVDQDYPVYDSDPFDKEILNEELDKLFKQEMLDEISSRIGFSLGSLMDHV